MATQKTYISLVCQEYGITLNVKGENLHINFKGGRLYPVRTYGKYSTDNPDIQEALENHPLYLKDWKIEGETNPPPMNVEVEPFAPTVMEELEPLPIPVLEPRIISDTVTTGNARIVNEPKTVQQVKEWLNRNEKVPFTKLKNKEEVFSVANELNIDFINVQKT